MRRSNQSKGAGMKIGLQELTDGMREQHRNALLALEAKLVETERQRDELLEALESMVEMVEMNGFGKAYAMDISRAAIAKARGQG
jgi:hypothetical protein